MLENCLFTKLHIVFLYHNVQVANGMSIWQQITKELSKLYSSEVETNSNATMKASSKPTKVPHKPFPKETGNNETDESIDDNTSTDGKIIANSHFVDNFSDWIY